MFMLTLVSLIRTKGSSELSMKKKRQQKKSVSFLLAISFLVFVSFCALFADVLAPYSLGESNITQQLCPISSQHLLGCDTYGADVLSQLLYGARVSLTISFFVVSFTTVLGCFLGAIAAFFGGVIDRLILQTTEVFMAFPGILLLLCLSSLMEMNLILLALTLSFTGWVGTARIVRGELLKCREYDYIMAARALGLSRFRIILFYLLPNIYPPVLVTATFGISGIIITEATLSFLGLGPQNTPSWGVLINQGRSVLNEAPSLSLLPGLCIFLLILSVNILGERMRVRFWEGES